HEIPVPTLFGLVVIDRDTAAEVLDLDAVVIEEGDVDAVAVAVARFVDRIRDDLKDRMGAAFHPVGAEDDSRALAHPVCALERLDTFVAVNLFFCHAASYPLG